jgi:hypothetical protein
MMPIRTILSAALALACTLCGSAAHAQLRLPPLQMPQLQDRLDPLNSGLARDAGRRLLDRADAGDLRALRLDQIGGLLKRHRDVLEPDPRGEPVVRGEILAWSPSAQGLAAAQASGLAVLSERVLGGGETMVVLRVAGGQDTAAALAQLRARDPDGAYDFNHIYTGSGAAPQGQAMPAGGMDEAARSKAAASAPIRVGLVDGGVDRSHDVFRDAAIVPWGCDGASHPGAHGTAVAALMVGRSARFQGVAPQAALYAADIYCDSGAGGSAARIAAALAWLAQEQVAVINLSLVGPPNQILERVVASMVKRGHLLVAAVGNDGPR